MPQTAAGARADALEVLDAVDAHQVVRLEHSVAQASQQVGAAGENPRFRLGRRCRRVFNRYRSLI